MKYQMREKLASIGDDSWIEDDAGNKVYKVDGKVFGARHIRARRHGRHRGREDPGAQAARARHDGDRARRNEDRRGPQAPRRDPAPPQGRPRRRRRVDDQGQLHRPRIRDQGRRTARSRRSRRNGSGCATPTASTSPPTTTTRWSSRSPWRSSHSPRSSTIDAQPCLRSASRIVMTAAAIASAIASTTNSCAELEIFSWDDSCDPRA